MGVARFQSDCAALLSQVKFFSQGDDSGTRSGDGSGQFIGDITPDSDLVVFLQSKGVSALPALPGKDDL